MTTSEVIALASLALAVFSTIVAFFRSGKTDAAGQARQEAKLDNIANGVDDIRVEQRHQRDRVDRLTERVTDDEGAIRELQHDVKDLKKYHQPH